MKYDVWHEEEWYPIEANNVHQAADIAVEYIETKHHLTYPVWVIVRDYDQMMDFPITVNAS